MGEQRASMHVNAGSSPALLTMEKEIERYYTDAIMERPYSFSVDGIRFNIYPATLGKSLLIQRLIEGLGIKQESLTANATAEVLRVVRKNRDTCLRVIAYTTCGSKEELFDVDYIQYRNAILDKGMNDEDIATLLLVVLTGDRTDDIISAYEIDKEIEMLHSAIRVKKDSRTMSFCGKSIYGTIIDVLCQRYGWTLDYVVWGISYANIRLLLADYVKEVHLTDEERQRLPANVLHKDEDVIMATKENMDMIRSMDWR